MVALTLAAPSALKCAMLRDPRYGALPDEDKAWLEARVSLFERIDAAKHKRAAFASEALRTHAGERWSQHTIRKAYYAWAEADRDWWAARNRSRLPEEATALPEAFVQHWHERCHEFGGKHKAAWRAIRREWQARKNLPGFEGEPWAPEMPRGCSYDNLMQPKYRPTAVQDRVAAIGVGAAHDLLPGVLSTRVGLRVGQRYVFDDMWHDMKTTVPGQLGARRILQFHALDLLSACQTARGMKPEILNDRSGRMERLKEAELLFLLAHMLGNLGYHPSGCVLMMEHGTASVSERVERFLYDATGGKITVERGGMGNSPLAPGLYAGAGRGNFKFKAALESLGNLIHNETADRLALPLQTGSNSRLNAPEEMPGREKALVALQTAALLLPAELRELVRYPAPPLRHALEFLDRVQEEINQRREHDLEGWEECGFVTQEFRTHPQQDWQPIRQLDDMAPALRAAMEAAIESDRRLARCRKLSPREVFDGFRHELMRLRAHHIPMLVGMDHAKEKAVQKDGRFSFADMELGPGTHIYDAVAHDEEGHAVRLAAGEKYAVFASTIDSERLHLCDARGAYVGWCVRETRARHGDAEAFGKACGAKIRRTREALAPVLADARRRMRQDAEAAESNQALFSAALRKEKADTDAKHTDAKSILLSRAAARDDDDEG